MWHYLWPLHRQGLTQVLHLGELFCAFWCSKSCEGSASFPTACFVEGRGPRDTNVGNSGEATFIRFCVWKASIKNWYQKLASKRWSESRVGFLGRNFNAIRRQQIELCGALIALDDAASLGIDEPSTRKKCKTHLSTLAWQTWCAGSVSWIRLWKPANSLFILDWSFPSDQ